MNWDAIGIAAVVLIQVGTLIWVVSNHGSRITQVEKRLDAHDDEHANHYRHESQQDIHQRSLSIQTLEALFKDVLNQQAAMHRENAAMLAEIRRNQERHEKYLEITSARYHDVIAPILGRLQGKFPDLFE